MKIKEECCATTIPTQLLQTGICCLGAQLTIALAVGLCYACVMVVFFGSFLNSLQNLR